MVSFHANIPSVTYIFEQKIYRWRSIILVNIECVVGLLRRCRVILAIYPKACRFTSTKSSKPKQHQLIGKHWYKANLGEQLKCGSLLEKNSRFAFYSKMSQPSNSGHKLVSNKTQVISSLMPFHNS